MNGQWHRFLTQKMLELLSEILSFFFFSLFLHKPSNFSQVFYKGEIINPNLPSCHCARSLKLYKTKQRLRRFALSMRGMGIDAECLIFQPTSFISAMKHLLIRWKITRSLHQRHRVNPKCKHMSEGPVIGRILQTLSVTSRPPPASSNPVQPRIATAISESR